MSFVPNILIKLPPLDKVWLAGQDIKKLTRKEIAEIDLENTYSIFNDVNSQIPLHVREDIALDMLAIQEKKVKQLVALQNHLQRDVLKFFECVSSQ